MKLGYCSLLWMKICNACTVAIPSILACVGPSLYLPLLAFSFSGAYPTTILHGLSPALAAIALRRRARKAGIKDGAQGTMPQIVPGGDVTCGSIGQDYYWTYRCKYLACTAAFCTWLIFLFFSVAVKYEIHVCLSFSR